jgi:hypothetical protein
MFLSFSVYTVAGAKHSGIIVVECHGMALPGLHVPLVVPGMSGKKFS